MERRSGHVLVLAYPAQGHINPLLQFAKRLASKGLKATFATAHYAVHSIDPAGVAVEPISDGYDEGGFKQAPSVEAYLESFKTVGSRTVAELILKHNGSDSPVNCLVYDSLLPWALDVARQLGIYAAAFMTNSASVCSVFWKVKFGGLTLPLKPENIPVEMPGGLSPLGLSDMPSFLLQTEAHSAYLRVINQQFSVMDQNDWVFVNTFEELEVEVANAMAGHWPLKMVGPMVPSAYLDEQIEGDTVYGGNLWKPVVDQCLKWLDTKPPSSVIYVSFGSMAEISAKQVEEIAWALRGINKHYFLWVVKDTEKQRLPIEFLDSTEEMGLVVPWCEQPQVLAHRAVGCFVMHCGWNSTLEALSLGVPVVAVPQWSDQPMNAKFVEEVWRVGVRAKKDDEGIMRREELERCIKEVMGGERSEDIRRGGSKWRESAKRAVSFGGSSDKVINSFIESLVMAK